MSDSGALVEYRGNCHCGAFMFTFKAPELKQASECDCSICSKNGYLWASPSHDTFTAVKGDEDTTLVAYEFGNRTLAHKFCPTCGTSIMARFLNPEAANGMTVLINLRALADLDFASLPVNPEKFPGAAVKPAYQPPSPVPVGPIPEGSTEYNGNCHCGAVAYTFLSPEEISTVLNCNCSICSRDGALWIHPAVDNVTFRGLESVTEYTFGMKRVYHRFCKICGVAISARFAGPANSFLSPDKMALNVRTMNDVDLGSLKVRKGNAKAARPKYKSPW
ncbi:glutathione-dependent formaldehyde-activating enzyme [Mycena pura]|uniref:Glutathione-dependent formaldehyde-activating enzyme n=1 Tax=Mycena pura TaxID=153505 RepID=A0AAD6Y7F6_9AGAR|nr:glutathione-dependent formaldehyde-activating enzyme [Mycena pura]